MTTLNLIELTKPNPIYLTMVFLFFALGVPLFIFSVATTNRVKNSVTIYFALIALICILISAIMIICGSVIPNVQEKTGKFHIEATFSEDMPFLAVMKEYNIIEQRGDVFILEPKERNVD